MKRALLALSLLTFVTGFRASDLGWLMLVSGLGMFAGNLWAGRLSLRLKPAYPWPPSAPSSSFSSTGAPNAPLNKGFCRGKSYVIGC